MAVPICSVLSGSGASWIANLVFKRSPLDVRLFAEAILGYGPAGHDLHMHDPVLSLLLWAWWDAPQSGFQRRAIRV